MNNRKKIEAVDFTKALAITCIVIYHLIHDWMPLLPPIFRTLSPILSTGNHAFLVLSGFGLFYSYKRRPLSYFRFLLKRASKIYIPYIIAVYLYYRCWDIYIYDVERLPSLLSHIFLYKMFIPKYMCTFGGHFWFISTIIQFYLVFHLLVKLYDKLGVKRFLILTFSLNVVWALFTYVTGLDSERVWNSFFLQFLFEFSLGMAAADYFDKTKELFERLSPLKLFSIGFIGYALLMLLYFAGGFLADFTDLPGAVGFVFCALSLYKLGFRPFNRLMVLVSSFSYEWYLTHPLVIAFLHFRFDPYNVNLKNQLLISGFTFVMTILFAVAFHLVWVFVQRIFSLSAGWIRSRLRWTEN